MTKEEFAKELKYHDWYYMMSEDIHSYNAGREKRVKLEDIAKTSPEFARMFDDMWFDHFGAPHFNKQNTRDKAPMIQLGLYTL